MNAVVEQSSTPQQLMTTEVTPMQMLHYAMSQGADLDRLEKLMELQERWEKNQAKKAFDAAISLAKAEIKPILKTREVDFVSRKEGAGRTNYKYEDFAQIATEVDPVLAKYGLSYRHRPRQEGKILHITCILSHRDGYSEESTLSAGNDESGNKNSIQAIGSTATYLQRYTLKLALGLAASKDDDAKAAEQGESEFITEQQAADLKSALTEVDANIPNFLRWAKAESIEKILANDFKAVMAAVDEKRRNG